MLTQDYVKYRFNYDEETGSLTWKNPTCHKCKVGDIAGKVTQTSRYSQVHLDYKLYYNHRLIWFWYHGVWPEYEIDHIDGDPKNNRIKNLREARHCENQQNMKMHKDNHSGHIGVRRHGKKWEWRIMIKGKEYNGYEATFDDACEAYREAKKNYHKFSPSIRENENFL